MPKPKKNETRKDFMSRCIPIVMKEGSGTTKKQASGKCGGIYDGKSSSMAMTRELTLSEIGSRVRAAWDAVYGNETPYSWVWDVFATYVIVRASSVYFKVPYTMDMYEVTFDTDSASEVSHDWTPVTRRLIPRPVLASEMTTRAGGVKLWKCYGVLFGDEDHKDGYGTYFTRDTDYCLDWYSTLPWLYHHTHHPSIGTRKVGTWKDKGVDDIGVFLLGELEQREKYLEAIEALLTEKALFPSSGTIGHVASAPQEDGYIATWPIAEVSSTVGPAEFRQQAISPKAIAAIKTLRGL